LTNKKKFAILKTSTPFFSFPSFTPVLESRQERGPLFITTPHTFFPLLKKLLPNHKLKIFPLSHSPLSLSALPCLALHCIALLEPISIGCMFPKNNALLKKTENQKNNLEIIV